MTGFTQLLMIYIAITLCTGGLVSFARHILRGVRMSGGRDAEFIEEPLP